MKQRRKTLAGSLLPRPVPAVALLQTPCDCPEEDSSGERAGARKREKKRGGEGKLSESSKRGGEGKHLRDGHDLQMVTGSCRCGSEPIVKIRNPLQEVVHQSWASSYCSPPLGVPDAARTPVMSKRNRVNMPRRRYRTMSRNGNLESSLVGEIHNKRVCVPVGAIMRESWAECDVLDTWYSVCVQKHNVRKRLPGWRAGVLASHV